MQPQPTIHPDIIAVFNTMDEAGAAMAALERGGIEASKISLVGRNADRAAEEMAQQQDTSGRDGEVVQDVTKSAGIGAALGGAGGLLDGIAAFAIPGVGPVVGTGIWIAALGGAVGGASVGGVVGGVSALPVGRDWELASNELRLGRAIVSVHDLSPDRMELAERILNQANPIAIDRPNAGSSQAAK